MMTMAGAKSVGMAALMGALLTVGCGDDVKPADTDTSTATETTAEMTAGTTDSVPTTTAEPTTTTMTDATTSTSTSEPTTSSTTSDSTTADSTTDDTTTGAGAMCNPTLQDCAEGQKCTAYQSMETPGWDANQCVPEPNNAGAVGDTCSIDPGESVFSGLDSCSKGTICLNFDFMTGEGGTCTAFCGEGNTCGQDEVCVEGANEGVLPICLAACDPLLQDCPDGQGCYGDPSLDGFICFTPDPGNETGTDGSPCEYTNACQPGFSCQAAETVEGCDGGSVACCTPFCSVKEGDAGCAPTEDCVPFYVMDAPPGLEDVGVCVIPA